MKNNIIVICALALSVFWAGTATAREGTDYRQGFNVFRIVGPTHPTAQKTSLSWGEQIVKGPLKGNNGVRPVAANFVVAPEPLGMVLYGLGGLPLVSHLLRRRKPRAV